MTQPVPVGLLNLGNTCYLNAAVQALAQCDGLVAHLFSPGPIRRTQDPPGDESKAAVASCMQTLLRAIKREFVRKTVVSPTSMVQAFGRLWASSQGGRRAGEQNDAHEAFALLVDACVADEVFEGRMQNVFACRACGHRTARTDVFGNLFLPAAASCHATTTGDRPRQTVSERLSCLTQPEPIEDYVCDGCKRAGHVHSFRRFEKLPQELVVVVKLSASSSPSSEVSLARESLISLKDASSHTRTYGIRWVICYVGAQSSGHYFACVRSSLSSPWFRVDDGDVRRLPNGLHDVQAAHVFAFGGASLSKATLL